MRVVVIGARPTGLTAAHRLACAGADVDVSTPPHRWEASRGASSCGGRAVDLGSRVFSTADPRVLELWQRYGRPLYERYFEAYARKLWGVPCAEIDAEFVRRHFGGAPVPVVGIDRFPYPALGTGSGWPRRRSPTAAGCTS